MVLIIFLNFSHLEWVCFCIWVAPAWCPFNVYPFIFFSKKETKKRGDASSSRPTYFFLRFSELFSQKKFYKLSIKTPPTPQYSHQGATIHYVDKRINPFLSKIGVEPNGTESNSWSLTLLKSWSSSSAQTSIVLRSIHIKATNSCSGLSLNSVRKQAPSVSNKLQLQFTLQ